MRKTISCENYGYGEEAGIIIFLQKIDIISYKDQPKIVLVGGTIVSKGKVANKIVSLLKDYYQTKYIINGTAKKMSKVSAAEVYHILIPYLRDPDKEYVTDRIQDIHDYWNQQFAGKSNLDFEDFVEGDLNITLLDSLYPDLIEDEDLLK